MTDRSSDPAFPWTYRGRPARPFALGISISSACFGALILAGDLGPIDAYAIALSIAALLGAGLLWVGWWGQHSETFRQGLAISAAVFFERAVFLALADSWPAAGVSLGLFVAAGGGYLLEADKPPWVNIRGLIR